MSNTQLRIISALVLAAIVATCFYFGIISTAVFLGIAGVLCVDELYCNFCKRDRFSSGYLITMAAFSVPYIYLHFLERNYDINFIFVNAGVVLNVFLLMYLFITNIDSKRVINQLNRYPFIFAVIILLPLCSLGSLLFFEKWLKLIIILMLVNFGMDTGAWFFGKNFGKNKLWPTVSPNKTIEGLVGGALTSGVVGVIFWNLLIDTNGFKYFVLFLLLGLTSQVGDLIQSKMKRQFGIKDSSKLIPGHGGVYDRVDSLIFVAPFYATFVNYLNF